MRIKCGLVIIFLALGVVSNVNANIDLSPSYSVADLKKISAAVALYEIKNKEEIQSASAVKTVYFYELEEKESFLGLNNVNSFCSNYNLTNGEQYLFFLGKSTPALKWVVEGISENNVNRCPLWLVGNLQGMYLYEGHVDESVVHALGIPVSSCLYQHGLRNEYSTPYTSAISYEFFKKMLLSSELPSECLNEEP